MDTSKKRPRGFGLLRNFGWKKNMLAIAAGFGLCVVLQNLTYVLDSMRLISTFNLSVAVMPLIGFTLSGWGVLGVVFGNILVLGVRMSDVSAELMKMGLLIFGMESVNMVLHCVLPCILWYAFPLKNEDFVRFPRLDTAAHVFKYYLIIVFSVALYVFLTGTAYQAAGIGTPFMEWATTFTEYLDVVLILGMLLLILISVLYYKTITINERMVLAFLLVGVLASALCGMFIYRAAVRAEPELFEQYDVLMASEADWTPEANTVFERVEDVFNWFYVSMAVMLNGLLIVEMLFMRRIEKRVTRPIIHLGDVLGECADLENKENISRVVAAKCTRYMTGYGEVSSLTDTCVNMARDIENYTTNLKYVTAEKERIGTELDVAAKIQRDMLPRIFPPFPERSEMTLYASMTPAREVGGDFYDYYLIDDDHLVLTIADVSGKGVPASLFMVISKTLLNNHAQSAASPKEILTFVNHQLCQNNQSMMFCTVWLGILNLKTGALRAANAGHEYPLLRRAGGQFERLEAKHDPPLGLRDGYRYREYEMQLAPGDCLFEYTDGVTEATDASMELFGDERLKEALNEAPEEGPEKQVERVYAAIGEFVKEAPQFDDITMLSVEYLGG